MKKIALLLLLSFGASAQMPFTNFISNPDDVVVCNNTNTEKPNRDNWDNHYGETSFKVLFRAWGCAAMVAGQPETCHSEVVEAGQCGSYHFKGSTTSRSVQICVPPWHGGASKTWNCGSASSGGHLQVHVHNGQYVGVKNLQYHYSDSAGNNHSVTGDIDIKNGK